MKFEIDAEGFAAACIAVAIVVAGLFVWLLYSGFVFCTRWGWFVVPLGVPPIGIAHAVGLSATVAVFRRGGGGKDDDKDAGWWVLHWLSPLIMLAMGAVAKAFMP